MHPCPETLASAVDQSARLLTRYLAGFDDTNHTAQAEHLPNHAAWTLGHCALYMHRLAERLDENPLPADDFSPEPARRAFGTELVAFGSKPSASPDDYPPLARCTEIYESACHRLAHAVRDADAATLTRPLPWGKSGEFPIWQLVQRITFHNGTHTGQLADLRRALGFPAML